MCLFSYNHLFPAKPLTVILNYQVAHKTSKAEDSGIIQGTVPIELQAGPLNTTDGKARSDLLKMLNGDDAEPVLFKYLFPKFLKVTNRGTATPVVDLMLEWPSKIMILLSVSFLVFRQSNCCLSYSV